MLIGELPFLNCRFCKYIKIFYINYEIFSNFTNRNAIDQLAKEYKNNKSNEIKELLHQMQYLVIENELFLPDMTNRTYKRNKSHVIAWLQGLSYGNTYKNSDNYKLRKVILPKTDKK